MKKIKQLTFVLFIVSALAFSYPVTQVFAQEGAHVSGNHISGVQCDSSPACNPASGTCCGQCDPGPACNPNDPNGIPCCGLEGNNMTNGSQPSGGFEPPRHPGNTNNLDPRLVEKMEKMRHELQACRSLKEEIRGQQQSLSGQGKHPAPTQNQCQPDSVSKSEHRATQRQLNMAMSLLNRLCRFINTRTGPDPLTPYGRAGYNRERSDPCDVSFQERRLDQARTGRYKLYPAAYDGYQCTLIPNTNECEEDSP